MADFKRCCQEVLVERNCGKRNVYDLMPNLDQQAKNLSFRELEEMVGSGGSERP